MASSSTKIGSPLSIRAWSATSMIPSQFSWVSTTRPKTLPAVLPSASRVRRAGTTVCLSPIFYTCLPLSPACGPPSGSSLPLRRGLRAARSISWKALTSTRPTLSPYIHLPAAWSTTAHPLLQVPAQQAVQTRHSLDFCPRMIATSQPQARQHAHVQRRRLWRRQHR
jgi:hypothetical protein